MKKFAISLLVLFAWTAMVHADEYDTMRQRLFDYLALGTYFDKTDKDVSTYQTAVDQQAKKMWDSMEKDPFAKGYLWSSYNKLKASGSYTPETHISSTYNSIRYMARAWASPASLYYHNHDLLTDIKFALNFMNAYAYNAGTPRSGSWYTWTIGIPEYYGKIMTLMYDSLAEVHLTNYESSVGPSLRNTVEKGNLTYANQANVCQELMVMGILCKNADYINSALTNSVKALVEKTTTAQRVAAQTAFENCWKVQGDYHKYKVTLKEGYYPDGTFIQHIALPYIMAYGMEQVELTSLYAQVLKGTSFKVPQEIIDFLPSLILNTYFPALYKGEAEFAFTGRSTAGFNPFENGSHIIKYIYQSAPLIADPKVRETIKAECREQERTATNPYSATAFNDLSALRDKPIFMAMAQYDGQATLDTVFSRYYPCGDRLIHQAPQYRFVLSMSSARIGKFESINNANQEGWYLGDGMTYIYLPTDRKAYVNYFTKNNGGYNWYRIPGTTVDAVKRTSETDNYGLFGTPANQKDRVGGVTLNKRYSVAAMDLVGQVSDLNAKKAWFCFDNEIVCLGAGINLSADRTVETIVENRKSKLAVTINGEPRENRKGVAVSHNDVQYMHLEGTGGYYFPQPTALKSWISYDGYTMVYFDHGKAPKNASYAYSLLPGMTSEQTTAYAQSCPISIIQNDTIAQAVWHKNDSIAELFFWQAGSVMGVTTSTSAAVLYKEHEDTLFIALSEPTQKLDRIEISLNGMFEQISASEDDLVHLSQENGKTIIKYNTQNRFGQGVELVLRGHLSHEDTPLHEVRSHWTAKKQFINGAIRIITPNQNYNLLGQPIQ